MWFVDEVVLHVRAGDGGNGCVSFRREAHVPRGGPDGGDGGRGGDVVFLVDPQLGTLLDLYYVPHQRAGSGRPGSGAQCSGRAGEDKVVKVPPGTVVVDDESDQVLADLVEPGLRWVAARGGKGGWGNQHFATPTRQAPDFAKPGLPGEQRRLRLQLKLIADIGLVGLPNAGKSTLIARISAARPKIADYPFTTLAPNLGVVKVDEDLSFAVADIPGLIEGSSQGAGLGHRFLRHVERVGLLVHLVEASPLVERDPVTDYRTVRAELAAYSDRLEEIEEVVVLSKRDLDEGGVLAEHLAAAVRAEGRAFFAISAVTGDGVRELVNHLGERIARKRASGTLLSAAALDDDVE
ncbi:MAG: GTPase ObgE [Deltaproteobacteria bacterium]|nr:GTPase ObgE [Deltaproteobacteria bacterium]